MIHRHAGTPRMRPLLKMVNAAALVRELDAHPELWNLHKFRTSHPMSPHREADDIWLRYNPIENLDPANPAKFNDEHEAQWYPEAADLPLIRSAVYELMEEVDANTLGAVLITRVPAGKQIYPHVDGGWHARAHRKFLVLLRGNAQQSFNFTDETMHAVPGEIFEFQNEYPHAVLNPTDEERISMIVCLRDFAPVGE